MMKRTTQIVATAGALFLATAVSAANPLIDGEWISRATGEDIINAVDKGHDPRQPDRYGALPIHLAAWTGNTEAIRTLVKKVHIDPNILDEAYSVPPIFDARDAETVALLVDLGASLALRSKGGGTPLDWAAEGDRASAVRELLYLGMQVNLQSTKYKRTSVYRAAWAAEGTETVKALLAHGADVKLATTQGMTPLLIAAKHNSPEMVELLLDAGSDPTARSDIGYTAYDYGRNNRKLRGTPALAHLKVAAEQQANHSTSHTITASTAVSGRCDRYLVQPAQTRLGDVAPTALGDRSRQPGVAALNGLNSDNPHRAGQCLKLQE